MKHPFDMPDPIADEIREIAFDLRVTWVLPRIATRLEKIADRIDNG